MEECVRRGSQKLYVLKKLRPLISKEEVLKVCDSLIGSSIYFAAPILLGVGSREKEAIDRLYRRCHKICCCRDQLCENYYHFNKRVEELSVRIFLNIEGDDENVLRDITPSRLRYLGKWCATSMQY